VAASPAVSAVRDKTNHMALYTQKFIAADYLARVQTQTHFFLRPLVRRAVMEEKRGGGGERRESSRLRELEKRRKGARNATRKDEDEIQ